MTIRQTDTTPTPEATNWVYDISVIIPVLNEMENLERCYAEVKKTLSKHDYTYEIIFIDDGSTDGSCDLMRSFAERDDTVLVIKLTKNFGQQKAYWVGFDACKGRSVVTYDADLQFPPQAIIDLSRLIFKGYSTAGGIRQNRQDSFFFNRIPSAIGNWLIRRALNVDQQDLGGIKAHSHSLVKQIVSLPQSQSLILSAAAYNLDDHFIEIPIEHHERTGGQSKWSVYKRLTSFLDIYTSYAERPFQWMLTMALALICMSFLFGLWVIGQKLFGPPPSGTIIFFTFFQFSLGFIFFGVSMIGEFVMRTYRAHLSSNIDMVYSTFRGHQSDD